MKSMIHAKSRAGINMKIFLDALSEIVPEDFLRQFSEEQVSSAIRYCKALQIRIERAYVSPEKDKMKVEQLAPHADKLKKIKPSDPSPACLELLQEYRTMLEEFKISLFAQEMKTRVPVSAKRLEKKWQEIENSC
jgi:ATP-dependent helicase HrpA